ncbi:MAG: hypothetical protein JO340_15060 [Acidobacteriaceae bacterium]|nr:hypothetical protein [Acidobacteriaceae bacterium]
MKRIRVGAKKDRNWSLLKESWRRIGLTAIAGALVGFGAAASTHESGEFRPVRIANTKTSTTDIDEMTRLETRNRRLEALVQVLRQRKERR